ncbi:metallophosphoesterase [Metallosphaera tengchongensis]|uniref:Metallophosphoesterase n=1 Tax=Metallosphaera tengchongensis TaxID=1532350 RepID=A0A6N0NVN3_9CREN|nr:metallophosphoesterase [Metallosphaera tengchongensis]QKQ99200.1 metallophosphoesterase [Metallosphaera tengchongensis]
MIFGAVSDIHSPRFLNQFFNSLRYSTNFPLIVLAGDLVDRGKVLHFDPVYRALKTSKVVAVFGNEDFREVRDEFRRLYPNVIWLEDSSITLELDVVKIYLVGSEGIISKPTRWQREIGINEEFYLKRKERVEKLLCDKKGDITILITHYSSTFETLYGEKRWAYLELGYPLIEELECKPNIAIHGHAHKSLLHKARIGETEVYNVALPATHEITKIKI